MCAQQKKRALGRGLEQLFGEIDMEVPAQRDTSEIPEGTRISENVVYIDIDSIRPNTMQPRIDFDPDAIESLANSIKEHGVIQPIMLRIGTNGYELIAGERRWRAARQAGLKEIPAIIRAIGDEENALFALIENMQREDLNPMEEAAAFRNIMDAYGFTQEDVSRRIGRSRPYVANTLRLLKLPEEIRTLISKGQLSLGHSNALGAVKEKSKQIILAKQIVREDLSVRETEILASKLSGKEKTSPANKPKVKKKNQEVLYIEEELTTLLGTKVTLNHNGKNGTVEIHYYSRDELDGIIEELRSLRK